MADITSYFDGSNVMDGGQINWRGDQVNVPSGGQSIYKTSSLKLCELGARRVVGDRVFRYAKAANTLTAGQVCESTAVNANVIDQTLAEAAVIGNKRLKFYAADAIASGVYADGYAICQTTGVAQVYRIKTQTAISSAGSAYITLYESIGTTSTAANKWSLIENPYKDVYRVEDLAGTCGGVVGVAPIPVGSGEYFWLQTWGPCAVQMDTAVGCGKNVFVGTTGLGSVGTATTGRSIGFMMQTDTAAQNCLTFLRIAP